MGLTSFNLAWIFEWSCSYSWNRTAVLVPVYCHGRRMTREAMGGDVHPLSLCVVECWSVKNTDNLTRLYYFLGAVAFGCILLPEGNYLICSLSLLFSFKVKDWQGQLCCQFGTWKHIKGLLILILVSTLILREHCVLPLSWYSLQTRCPQVFALKCTTSRGCKPHQQIIISHSRPQV